MQWNGRFMVQLVGVQNKDLDKVCLYSKSCGMRIHKYSTLESSFSVLPKLIVCKWNCSFCGTFYIYMICVPLQTSTLKLSAENDKVFAEMFDNNNNISLAKYVKIDTIKVRKTFVGRFLLDSVKDWQFAHIIVTKKYMSIFSQWKRWLHIFLHVLNNCSCV